METISIDTTTQGSTMCEENGEITIINLRII